MKEQNKDPKQPTKIPEHPPADAIVKEAQREKAEAKEVAGRHKNDAQISHKGRR